MPAYYNEIDPYAAEWLRELIKGGHIAPGDVDERDIRDVNASDLAGYEQCHFFAGIGGWSHALRLADWPDHEPVWTGSCPCQPFSAAGARQSVTDERHLWPHWFRLIRERRPPTIFGEQVASAIGDQWLDAVAHDLEMAGYATGASVLPACAVGAPHIRERLWFVADATQCGRNGEQAEIPASPCQRAPGGRGGKLDLANANEGEPQQYARPRPGPSEETRSGTHGEPAGRGGAWWLSEPEVGRVVDGFPSRVERLRALGNAIVPQVAAAFIAAFAEIR